MKDKKELPSDIKYTKPKKEKNVKPQTINEILKYEIAEELGLLDKVNETGWRSLTAKESGRIGGLVAKKKKDLKNSENQQIT